MKFCVYIIINRGRCLVKKIFEMFSFAEDERFDKKKCIHISLSKYKGFAGPGLSAKGSKGELL